MAVTQLDGARSEVRRRRHLLLTEVPGRPQRPQRVPRPDGDAGSNMYLTARRLRGPQGPDQPLAAVAAAAAKGSLLGARGNSGVILSQMLPDSPTRAPPRENRHVQFSLAMREAGRPRAPRSQAGRGHDHLRCDAAAEEAYRLAVHEPDFYRFASAVLRAANDAFERTPEQFPRSRRPESSTRAAPGSATSSKAGCDFSRHDAHDGVSAPSSPLVRCSPAGRWSATTSTAPSSFSRSRRRPHPLREELDGRAIRCWSGRRRR